MGSTDHPFTVGLRHQLCEVLVLSSSFHLAHLICVVVDSSALEEVLQPLRPGGIQLPDRLGVLACHRLLKLLVHRNESLHELELQVLSQLVLETHLRCKKLPNSGHVLRDVLEVPEAVAACHVHVREDMLPAFALVWIRGNPRPETKHEQILRFRDVVRILLRGSQESGPRQLVLDAPVHVLHVDRVMLVCIRQVEAQLFVHFLQGPHGFLGHIHSEAVRFVEFGSAGVQCKRQLVYLI
mmetsp:Transcript_47333/g.112507  ORF Transcript_47333/g.112507 Transcript_47333/m.112507 type:complete len:239 (+) Transcript_47333:869-1585(+)